MKKKWIILGLVLIIGTGTTLWFSLKPNTPEITYKPIKVSYGDIHTAITSTGTVAPKNRVEIKAPISGRVEAILVQEGDHVKKGQILAWLSSIERAALLDIARIKGEKEVKYWEELYKPTPLISPISGTIIARVVEPGQTVNQDPILVIADQLIIKAQVDETDIGKIKLNQATTAILDAYPDDEIPCVVQHIAFEAKTVNNVTIYEVDIMPKINTSDKDHPQIKSGMSSEVSFILERKDHVLCIPIQALDSSARRRKRIITSVKNGKEPQYKTVQTGLSNGQLVEVISGLEENEVIFIPSAKASKKKKNNASPFMPTAPQRGGGGTGGGGGRQR